MPSTERFEPAFARVVRHWTRIWITAGAVALGVLWIENGGLPPLAPLLAGLGGLMLLVLVVLAVEWRQRLLWVEVGPDALRYADRLGTWAVLWNEIEDFRHYRSKREQWRFWQRGRARRHALTIAGFPGDADRRLADAIYAHLVRLGRAERLANGRHRRIA